jgi:hypothetical protein
MKIATGLKLVLPVGVWITGSAPSAAVADGNPRAINPADTTFSGIVEYVFEPNPNPREIKPRMYNWEVRLNAADSRNGPYEIVQITRPLTAATKVRKTETEILVDAGMIVGNQDGIIPFRLHVGDKEPSKNMNGPGNIGQPIVFSGKGTGKGASSWIVLPGARVDRVTPSGKGTRLSNGRLSLIQYIVTNDRGEKFQADVVLRRK